MGCARLYADCSYYCSEDGCKDLKNLFNGIPLHFCKTDFKTLNNKKKGERMTGRAFMRGEMDGVRGEMQYLEPLQGSHRCVHDSEPLLPMV